MKINELLESSPDTPQGSVTRDLVISKLWLCKCLETLRLTAFDNIYVLGSWYGATAIVIKSLPFSYHTIVCVDNDPTKVAYFDQIINKKKYNDVLSVRCDVDQMEYSGTSDLVINSSTNDIVGTTWLENIPSGTIVALQGKNHQERSNGIETLTDFNHEYPLSKTLFVSELEVKDVEGNPYSRFMKIGYR